MSTEVAVLLCNTSGEKVVWQVTPDGHPPVIVNQYVGQYGSVTVPGALRYTFIANGGTTAEANRPDVAAVFDGHKISILVSAG